MDIRRNSLVVPTIEFCHAALCSEGCAAADDGFATVQRPNCCAKSSSVYSNARCTSPIVRKTGTGGGILSGNAEEDCRPNAVIRRTRNFGATHVRRTQVTRRWNRSRVEVVTMRNKRHSKYVGPMSRCYINIAINSVCTTLCTYCPLYRFVSASASD